MMPTLAHPMVKFGGELGFQESKHYAPYAYGVVRAQGT
jgi:hypothetical protein